ncbi:MAG: DUF6958 family protein [Bacteroidota bacterium]|jgi:hypothetical protein|nr:hypothetical protein [Flammeovirgaceae bacterium]MCZ8069662.1 hypothetical protein [Cytophagales bacterium]
MTTRVFGNLVIDTIQTKEKDYWHRCAYLKSKKAKQNTVIMSDEKIQTLHPLPGKTNKRISLDKYNTIKDSLLKALAQKELTHTQLMEDIHEMVKDTFKGGVQWYAETVKLDLEARKIIERTSSKPQKYRLKQSTKG